MSTSLALDLPQLRLELETCAQMDASRSLLLRLRRQLVRHYHTVPCASLQAASLEQRRQYHENLRALTAPAPFPAPCWAVQYAQTEQALALLEQLA